MEFLIISHLPSGFGMEAQNQKPRQTGMRKREPLLLVVDNWQHSSPNFLFVIRRCAVARGLCLPLPLSSLSLLLRPTGKHHTDRSSKRESNT